MTIQQLIYVIEIEKNRSFNQAAQILYISQPTLSKAVNSLEDELGITIFIRSHKGVKLTSEGRRFLTYANSIVHQFREIKKINFVDEKNQTSLKIATIHSTFISEAFVKLCKLHPDEPVKHFSMNNMSTPEVIQNVDAGNSELGIIWLGNDHKEFWLNAIHSKGMEYQRICTTNLSVLLSKDDPLAQKDALILDDLRNYTYIHFHLAVEEESESLKYLDEFSLLNRSIYSKAIITTDRDAAYQLISDTKAFIFAYNHHKSYARAYNIACVPLFSPTVEAEIGLIKKSHRAFSSLAKLFLSILRKELKNQGQDNIRWLSDPDA